MRLLKHMIYQNISIEGRVLERKAARGIILRGNQILLLFTRRYNDYSFPGGGLEPNEELVAGLKRELKEEIGAKNIEIIQEYGYIDEYRPHYKPDYDFIHMLSYFYVCRIDDELEDVQLEDYELANGMSSVWMDIHKAISHNKKVIQNQESSMGLSIERETFVLEHIAEELLCTYS
jgi:8-oxo-dGTP pyrophosphatase MutT (NUDIX family)